MILLAVAALLPLSCKKEQKGDKASIQMEVSEISTLNAVLNLSCKGPKPALVRITQAVPREEFIEELGSLENEDGIINYVKTNGFAVSLPYSNAVKDLSPSTDYVIGAVSFDSKMDLLSWAVVEFRTEELGSSTVGDASGAGSLDDNELEDKE